MTRPEMLNAAVVEAARAFMAAQLRSERIANRAGDGDAILAAYNESMGFTLDALQSLRDACAAQSRVRVRR